MRRFLLSFLVLMCHTPVFAFGNDESWTFGGAMGIAEAVINKGPGNQIYVSCGSPTQNGSVTGVRFTLMGDSSKSDTILLTFDGDPPQEYRLNDGSIASATRADAFQFEHVIERFRTKQWVNVRFENGTNAIFSLKGANKAISNCPTDFSQ